MSPMPLPQHVYHATYGPYVDDIRVVGLHGDNEVKNYDDSQPGVVYLAIDWDVAYSYAETSDTVPQAYLDDIVVFEVSTAGLDPARWQSDRNVIDGTATFEYHGPIPAHSIRLVPRPDVEPCHAVQALVPCWAP